MLQDLQEHKPPLTFTCSKAQIEPLEKGGKYFQSYNKNDVIDFVLLFLLLTLNIFHTFY